MSSPKSASTKSASAAASSACVSITTENLSFKNITFQYGNKLSMSREDCGVNHFFLCAGVLLTIFGIKVYFVLAQDEYGCERLFLFVDLAKKYDGYKIVYIVYEIVSIQDVSSADIANFVRSLSSSRKTKYGKSDFFRSWDTWNPKKECYNMSVRSDNGYNCYFPDFTKTDYKPLQQNLDVYAFFSRAAELATPSGWTQVNNRQRKIGVAPKTNPWSNRATAASATAAIVPAASVSAANAAAASAPGASATAASVSAASTTTSFDIDRVLNLFVSLLKAVNALKPWRNEELETPPRLWEHMQSCMQSIMNESNKDKIMFDKSMTSEIDKLIKDTTIPSDIKSKVVLFNDKMMLIKVQNQNAALLARIKELENRSSKSHD